MTIAENVRSVIARAWGADAAAALDQLEASLRGAQGVTIANAAALPWPQIHRDAIPSGHNEAFFFVVDRWQSMHGLDALRALIEGVRPGVSHAADIHTAFELLLPAKVIRDEAEVERLCALAPQADWADPPRPAPREARALFEPPYVDGRRVVFQTNQRGFGTVPNGWVRTVIDTETCSVDQTRLCDGANEGVRFYLRGRGYEGVLPAIVKEQPQPTSPTAGRAWLEAARAEHASIASFARATLELLAVGGPLELVARMQQAALDEVEHTRLSLARAKAAGVDAALGALPALSPRALSLAELARVTLLEAALPETRAVDEARLEAGRHAHDPDERDAWLRIARDEAEHAALAWDVVAWCLAEDARRGRDDVRCALAAVAADAGVDVDSAARLRAWLAPV